MKLADFDWIDLQDAADYLGGVPPIVPMRLIAKGHLKDVKVAHGQRRISKDSLTRYSDAGAPDLKGPPILFGSGSVLPEGGEWTRQSDPVWFDRDDDWAARQLPADLAELAQDQRLSDAQFAARIAAEGPLASFLTVDLRLTDPMRELLNGPPVPSAAMVPNSSLKMWKSWLLLWAANALRDLAAVEVDALFPDPKLSQSRLMRFYGSREVYETVRDASIRDLLARNIVGFSEYRASSERPGLVVTVVYRLKNSTFLTEPMLRGIATDYAF